MPQTYRLVVNGVERQVAAPDDMSLLEVLRDELGLRGSRFGCGEGTCGACTVLIDGKARTACDAPIATVENAVITTIEGLSRGVELHPVQQAFVDLQAGQCGYCLNGIIMRIVALLGSNPRPTRAEAAAVLDQHLCRCGTHDRILKAVDRAAELSRKVRV